MAGWRKNLERAVRRAPRTFSPFPKAARGPRLLEGGAKCKKEQGGRRPRKQTQRRTAKAANDGRGRDPQTGRVAERRGSLGHKVVCLSRKRCRWWGSSGAASRAGRRTAAVSRSKAQMARPRGRRFFAFWIFFWLLFFVLTHFFGLVSDELDRRMKE